MPSIRALWGAFVISMITGYCGVASAAFVRTDMQADPTGQFLCGDTGEWCFGLAQQPADTDTDFVPVLLVLRDGQEVERQKIELATDRMGDIGGWRKTAVWPVMINDPNTNGAFLVGINTTTSVGYSGGGASVSMLSLIKVTPETGQGMSPVAPKLDAVATLPIEASKMIRACFDQQDMIDRQQQCHDVYEFAGDVEPVPASEIGGLPTLRYQTVASKFPPNAALDRDSTTQPPLGKDDMTAAPDPNCQFDALFQFDPARQHYQVDVSFDACDTYLIP
ncbi:hypothetical protein LPB41_12735 [Thalassospira sp. MA62]|nr:hypothetical protein [Thalassospira sp. MA62]